MQRSSPSMFKWHGIIVPPEIQEAYQTVIDKLVYGPRNALDLKRLAGHKNLYSVRVNDADRLLFTTIEYKGKRYFNFCDVVLNHRHDRCALLQPDVLEFHRERDAAHLKANEVTEDHFISIGTETGQFPEVAKRDKGIEVVTHFDRSKFFVLNTTQDNIVNANIRYPVVVKGYPGSGKSCVVIAMLEHYAEKYLLCDDDLHKENAVPVNPALCIVKSTRVCAFLKRAFELSPVGLRYTKGQVQFRSYNQFIRDTDPNAANRVEVGRSEFEAYIQDKVAQTKLRERHREKILSDKIINEVDHYQECRIISGMDNPDDYLALGAEQSQITEKAEREWLYDVKKHYITYLHDNNLIDFSFYTPTLNVKYSMMAVDEAVDFSSCELKVLSDLVENSRILYCIDENQCLNDRAKKEPFLKKLLNAKDGKMTLVELSGSYRCGKIIIDVANNVSALRGKLTSRKLPPMEFDDFSNQGAVNFTTVVDKKIKDALKKLAAQPNFAIVTTASLKALAINEFGTDNVFTAEEIKGLEFETVCLYRLMESPIFYKMNKSFATTNGDEDEFIPALNEYYTACTRAVTKLIIIETATVKLKNLLPELTRGIEVSPLDSIYIKMTKEEIEEKLLSDLRLCALRGDLKRARKLGKDLNKTKDEVEKIINKFAPAVIETPVVAAPVAEIKSSNRSGKKRKNKSASTANVASTLFKPNAVAVRMSPPKRIPKTEFTTQDLEKLASQTTYVHEDINDVFMSPKALTYLFDIPVLKKRTCFLTALADNEVTRHGLIQILLPAHFMLIGPRLKGPYLNRGYDGGTSQPGAVPLLFWICFYAGTLSSIMHSPAFEDFWKVENLTSLTTYVTTEGAFTESSALYMLAADPKLHYLLNLLIDQGQLAKKLKVKEDLLHKISLAADSYFKLSVLDYLLSARDSGILMLEKLITQNQELAYGLNIADLFSLPLMSSDTSILYTIISSKVGARFIKKLQQINPGLSPYDLTKCTKDECMGLHRIVKPVIKDMQSKLNYIKNMLQGFRQGKVDLKKSLINLLFSEKSSQFAHLYFFNLYLYDESDQACYGENLFYNLMYHEDTRKVFIDILISYSHAFTPHVTSLSLIGKKVTNNSKVLPLHWMLVSNELREVLNVWLKVNSLLKKMIPVDPLYIGLEWEEYIKSGLMSAYTEDPKHNLYMIPGSEVSCITLMSLTPTGRELFKQIAAEKEFSVKYFPCSQFTTEVLECANKKRYSLLSYFVSDYHQHDFLLAMTRVLSTNQVQLITDEFILKQRHSAYGDDSSIMSHLMTIPSGLLFIEILTRGEVQERRDLARHLFSVFDNEGPDDAEIVRLFQLMVGYVRMTFKNIERIVSILTGLAIKYPDVVTESNVDCFVTAKANMHEKNVTKRVQIAREVIKSANSEKLIGLIFSMKESKHRQSIR